MKTKKILRPIALITGSSRKIGIGAAIASGLAETGWDVAITYWRKYDSAMQWGDKNGEVAKLLRSLSAFGARTTAIEEDLSDIGTPNKIFNTVEKQLGPVSALVLSHCYSINSNIIDTSIESFERHFAVNARATWLLVREFGLRYKGGFGDGRIVSITSDNTTGNLPYGASKGAMDRIVLSAAEEFKVLGVTANVINPGPTDTGWMTKEQKLKWGACSPLGRVSLPKDCANLVKFLCSKEGGWINKQLLHSDGGSKQ